MLFSEYLTKKRPYQEYGHHFLLERKHACLGFSPGKGKTYPAVEAMIDVDKSKNGTAKVLILSTANAIKNMWLAEIVPQNILPKHTTLVSITKAVQNDVQIELLRTKWDIICLDECHRVKAHNTKIAKLLYKLTKKCEFVWGLSGTPRGNSDVDIYCQFHNLNIGDWGKINYTFFVENICDYNCIRSGGKLVKIPTTISHKYKAGWERNVAMYYLCMDYEETDAMPELTTNVITLPFTPSKEYLLAQDGVISLPDYETTLTQLTAINKLHQAANGFLYYEDSCGERRTYSISDKNEKLDWLDRQDLRNTVIVYRFAEDRERIKSRLGQKYTLTELVDDFKANKTDILLLQCSQCESFNLQSCNKMIFHTLDYSFINYDQMIHRVWRMGQTKPVDIYILIYQNSVEEKIWSTVENKRTLAQLFMAIKGV